MVTEYTTRDRLVDIDKAIHAIMITGQSYKIGSRSLTRADLAVLKAMRDDLAAQLAEEESQSHLFDRTYVAVFDSR